jgi:hypothetical protein
MSHSDKKVEIGKSGALPKMRGESVSLPKLPDGPLKKRVLAKPFGQDLLHQNVPHAAGSHSTL